MADMRDASPFNKSMVRFDEYKNKYSCVDLTREDGILQVTMHDPDGGHVVWREAIHRELPLLWADISMDRDNRCVILTGTGDGFISEIEMEAHQYAATPWGWDKLVLEGTKLLTNLLDIRVPIIAAVNGPATTHSEIPLLCDIVICSDNTIFQDQPHFWNGLVPGDGIAAIWQLILGPVRGRYFLLTGQQIPAQEALALGVVSEVLPRDELLPRAWEIAREIVKRPPLVVHYTKHVLVHELRRIFNEQAFYGLVLEGAAASQDGLDKGGYGMGLAKRTTGVMPDQGFDLASVRRRKKS